MKTIICNTSESPRSTRAHSYEFYLVKIRELDGIFDKLEAFCTDGDIRPPFPYQWRATTKIITGDDDPCEGLGGSPLEALRELYKNFKVRMEYEPTDEELEN